MKIPADWTFRDVDVVAGFDTHVREQLPWYDLMAGAVAHIARHFIPEGGTVYDLGCSTGNIGVLLADVLATRRASFIAVDNAPEMQAAYRGPGRFVLNNISDVVFDEPFDVAIVFLSMMFVPVARRALVFGRLRGAVRPGGAIIVVDKVSSFDGYLGTVMARLTLAGKVATGVAPADIIAKELSLIGVQRPLSRGQMDWATEVFRFGEFAGWVYLA